jgi:glycogen synthase kinase 3 beta
VLDLVGDVLVYYPGKRLKAIETAGHAFFDELRDPKTEFKEEYEKHKLFELTQQELSMSPEMEKDLVPRHVKDAKAK